MRSKRATDPRKNAAGNTARSCISVFILLIVALGADRGWAKSAFQSAHQCRTPVLWHFAFFIDDLGRPGQHQSAVFPRAGFEQTGGLLKNAQITERTELQFRGEFFNVFNHAQFLAPAGSFIASNFGQVTAARDPRIGQVSVKSLF